MDDLKNKRYVKFDYLARYTGIPVYYNKRDNRELFGLSKNMIKKSAWVAHKVVPTDIFKMPLLN